MVRDNAVVADKINGQSVYIVCKSARMAAFLRTMNRGIFECERFCCRVILRFSAYALYDAEIVTIFSRYCRTGKVETVFLLVPLPAVAVRTRR